LIIKPDSSEAVEHFESTHRFDKLKSRPANTPTLTPAAAIMFALLAELARAERETLSERIKSGLAEARKKGRKLGRPSGTTLNTSELLLKHKDICRWLRNGQSVRNTAKISGKGASTVQRVKAALAKAA
jgi:DNA invertase Pin-like site-specific DNA recombinase